MRPFCLISSILSRPNFLHCRPIAFTKRAMSNRSYKDAVEHLNSLQSNAAALEAARASGTSRLSEFAIPEMLEYLERIGYTVRTGWALQISILSCL